MTTKFYVIAYSENMGRTFYGKPQVVTADELQEHRDEARQATADNWDVCILSELNIELDKD